MGTTVKTLYRSFAGGVITPEMFGRLDLVKFQTGLAESDGFIILPHGPAANRTGTEYVLEVKDSTALTCILPFVYSTSQSMVLEFGNQYLRFHTLGGNLLEAPVPATAISQANPGVINRVAHGFTTGQWVFSAGIAGMTTLNSRFYKVIRIDADNYSLTDLWNVAINTLTLPAYGGGGTFARVYEIATPYVTADLFDLHFTQSADVLTITHPSYQQRELRRLGATNWTLTTLGFASTIATPAAPGGVAAPVSGGVSNFYVTTAIAAGTLEESLPSGITGLVNDLTVAGNINTVTPSAVAGQVRTNVFKLLNGLYGFIAQSDGSAIADKNITPDTTRTPPIADAVMAAINNWPTAVGYYGGRRWFGGTNTAPQNMWGTKSGTESNMAYSIPTRDDDRIAFRIAARQANAIRHILPLEDLVVLTSSGEWVIAATTGTLLTPASVDPRPKGAVGASNVQPILTGQSALYAQDRGGRMREFIYAGDINGGYRTNDISIMAPHYFDNFTIKQLAFTRAPYPIAWAVRSDGVLLGLTYIPEQQVLAWHSHSASAGGFFESVCVVPEGNEDVLYLIVRRVVNGRTVRYVERMHSRLFATLADAYFVDAGVVYSGAPITVLSSGLQHLEGCAVNVLADGAVIPNVVITNGTITLDQAASKIMVGLPIVARFKTLPISLETQALGQGTQKNVNKVYMRVANSSGIHAGTTYATVKEHTQRTNEPYGAPPATTTDEIDLVVDDAWNNNGEICVQQADPLPLTVLSMTMEVAIGS